MAYAYEATAHINGRSAGYVGTFISKADYRPYPSAPSVRWKRVSIDDDIAELMRQGVSYKNALQQRDTTAKG